MSEVMLHTTLVRTPVCIYMHIGIYIRTRCLLVHCFKLIVASKRYKSLPLDTRPQQEYARLKHKQSSIMDRNRNMHALRTNRVGFWIVNGLEA